MVFRYNFFHQGYIVAIRANNHEYIILYLYEKQTKRTFFKEKRMNIPYSQCVPNCTYTFKTKEVASEPVDEYEEACSTYVLFNKEHYRIRPTTLNAIRAYKSEHQFVFDMAQNADLPTEAYTRASGDDINEVVYRYGLLRIHKANFINCLHKITIEKIPHDIKGIRIRQGVLYFDVKNEDDIQKCLLAIYGARLLIIMGARDFKWLQQWVRNTIPSTITPDTYATFPIYSYIKHIAQQLLECSLFAHPNDNTYAQYIYDTCTQFIATYREMMTHTPGEPINTNLLEIQKMIVGTLVTFVTDKSMEVSAMEAFFIHQLDCSYTEDEDLQEVLKNMINTNKLYHEPILRYYSPTDIKDLNDFCTHCQRYNLQLQPSKELQNDLNQRANLLPIINNLILSNATLINPDRYKSYTHGQILKKIGIYKEIFDSLKAPFLDVITSVCQYLKIPPFKQFESIDFDKIHTAYEGLPKSTSHVVCEKLKYTQKRHVHQLIDFAQFSHQSIEAGYFRIPKNVDESLPCLDPDMAYLIDELPHECQRYMPYLSPQQLQNILYLITLKEKL